MIVMTNKGVQDEITLGPESLVRLSARAATQCISFSILSSPFVFFDSSHICTLIMRLNQKSLRTSLLLLQLSNLFQFISWVTSLLNLLCLLLRT